MGGAAALEAAYRSGGARAAADHPGLHAQRAGLARGDAPARAGAGADLLRGLRLVGRGDRRSGQGGAARRRRRGHRRRQRSADRARRGARPGRRCRRWPASSPAKRRARCGRSRSDRSGFALGEGAAFLVLESAERARRRGARSYAPLAGWGISCDATHLTKPDAPGQARALRAALRQAGLQPRDVGYCNAHGTATRIGDVVERDALAAGVGRRARPTCASARPRPCTATCSAPPARSKR